MIISISIYLRTGAIQEKTFRAGEKVEQAMIENRRMQYLYADGDNHVFAPVLKLRNLERTNAEPLPGFTCWKSITFQMPLSTCICTF
jgi:hypothetical protein